MAHMAASWPDQVLCKENKRAALEAQHKSWMCQRDKALREQATTTTSNTTASNATAPEPDESHEDDELHEELQEITAFLDGVGCAIEDATPRAAASAGDDDGDGASSFVDSDEELDDAAFARYAAARRRQLSSADGDSGGDGRAVGDDEAETSWATLGAAAHGAKCPPALAVPERGCCASSERAWRLARGAALPGGGGAGPSGPQPRPRVVLSHSLRSRRSHHRLRSP